MRFSWTQPACADCYLREFGREPRRLVQEARSKETCCYCGRQTLSGIYVRVDPLKAGFPTLEKD